MSASVGEGGRGLLPAFVAARRWRFPLLRPLPPPPTQTAPCHAFHPPPPRRSYLVDRANLLLFLDASPAPIIPPSGSPARQRQPQQQRQQRLLSLQEVQDLLVASGATLGRHLVYCKLLRAGYIVQRHPARWLLRLAEDPAQVWAAWGQAQPSQLQESNQQSNQQQQLPGAGGGDAAPPSTLPPPGPAPKKRRVVSAAGDDGQGRRQQRWWLADGAAAARAGAGAVADPSRPGTSNPWLCGLPAGFLDSLPRCVVLPTPAQRALADFPRMAPLQPVPLADLQPLVGGAAAGRHLLVSALLTMAARALPGSSDDEGIDCFRAHPLYPPPPSQHFDVYNSNSKFSRKQPGQPMFTVAVMPCSQLPTPEDMAAADAAAGSVPVRFATVEKGDICFYGLSHVQLRTLF